MHNHCPDLVDDCAQHTRKNGLFAVCGICGIVGEKKTAAIRSMTAAMRHRGPDGEGYYLDEKISLGMRRLGIIDLAGGTQPLSNEDGTVHLVCNGEIYNYRELHCALRRKGHRFATESDAEVIVHLYEEYGEEAVQHLRGMFAFALWDTKAAKLLLVRDRLGIKPLYHTAIGSRLYFASEIKALLACPEVPRRVNTAMLGMHLTLQYVPGPQTLFEGIMKLRPGHYLRVQDGSCTEVQYWDVTFAEGPCHLREDEVAEALQAQLHEAVRLHLRSDVPVGSLLSGGVDSSLVVALMVQASGERHKTFTIGYDQASFDERPYARRVAAALGTEHYDTVVTPADVIQTLPSLIWLLEEPVADQAALPTYLICQLAAEHVKVVLTGEGGDELGGGYPRYGWFRLAKRLQRFLPPMRPDNLLCRYLDASRRQDWLSRRVQSMCCDLTDGQRHLRWVGNFTPEQCGALLADEKAGHEVEEAVTRVIETFLHRGAKTDSLHALMYLDMKTWLVDDVLTKMDKMSMGTSLEARVPLLDHQLVEFMASLPSTFKIRRLGTTKRLLRHAAATVLPPAIARRPKQAFRVPIGLWLRGSMREFVRDTLLSVRATQRGYFNPTHLTTMVDEHETGRKDHTQRLWNLLTLELWHQTFIDTPSTSS